MLFIRQPQQIVNAGLIELGKLDENIRWYVPFAHFVMLVTDLCALQILSDIFLIQVSILTHIANSSIHIFLL